MVIYLKDLQAKDVKVCNRLHLAVIKQYDAIINYIRTPAQVSVN